MAGETNFGVPGADAFTAFWSDFFGKMVSAGIAPQQPSADMTERMRKAFFESFTKYADEFMRSEPFLKMMKQSMDHALAWQQTMNQYLQKGLAGAQMPSKPDAEHIGLLVRGMEDRVMDKLEEMSKRIDHLEKGGKSPK
jgi:hypothetical protein